ncbi:DJ-1/PfpI family protein [Streptomyces sp. DSM 42041]|uniref:DJ-1/PfpI family protein n=1 Tax=Streptomyces hazeniae TaxID=3075538 RepID=A0ABU2NRW4_9ACTN|nr:DJ-1/PfpI family protein [Streptomyces sp. DSM 42041]MDT0379724.1 DJ-1/PfpI family protein [Streptomyces sp. DSM 42041]
MSFHLAVYDTLADYEYGHVAAHLPGGVTTVGLTPDPVTTKAGLRVQPDMVLADLDPADSALLVLPGADLWFGDALAPFARTARTFLDAGVPVAAICGATFGLAAEGLLDDRDHTSAAAEYLAASGYRGGDRYREADAVTDGDLITAGPTDPVAFAREIFGRLGTFPPEVLGAWYRLFHDSDAAAYPVFAAAQG